MRVVLAVIALLLCACSKKKQNADTSPRAVRVWTDAELAELEASLGKRIDENNKRSCVRPVLRGTPTPGSAGPDIVALAGTTGAVATCLRDVAIAEQDGKLGELIDQRAPQVVSLVEKCGPDLEKAITAIVQHEDACSPYQTGVRADPGTGLTSMLRASRMLALRGRLRAESGDVVGGLWLQLETARAMQDLRRGQTSVIVAMIATAAEKAAIDAVHAIMSTSQVPLRSIGELDTAIEALIASTPHIADSFHGDVDYSTLHMGVARGKPAAWSPPGGRTDITASDAPRHNEMIDPRDEAAMMLAHGTQRRAVFDTACPTTATWEACVRQLGAEKSKRSTSPSSASPEALATQLVERLDSKLAPDVLERSRREIQRLVVEALLALSVQTSPDYARKGAYTLARLAAARVHLAAQRMGRCPTDVELQSASFMALRKPATLGDALVPERTTTDLVLHAPAWATDQRNKDPVGSIRCH